SLITSADKKVAEEEYKLAIVDYQAAAKVKPSESYPRTKIDELNELLVNMAVNEEAKKLQEEQRAKNEMAFQDALATGDKNFDEEKWDEAIIAYQKALELKSNENYPKERIQRIQQIKEEAEQKNLAAEEKQKEIEKELLYNTL